MPSYEMSISRDQEDNKDGHPCPPGRRASNLIQNYNE